MTNVPGINEPLAGFPTVSILELLVGLVAAISVWSIGVNLVRAIRRHFSLKKDDKPARFLVKLQIATHALYFLATLGYGQLVWDAAHNPNRDGPMSQAQITFTVLVVFPLLVFLVLSHLERWKNDRAAALLRQADLDTIERQAAEAVAREAKEQVRDGLLDAATQKIDARGARLEGAIAENIDLTKMVAEKVGEVVETTVEKLDSLKAAAGNTQRMGEAVHVLVNSNMGIQLGISARFARRIADLTGDPKDAEIADQAEQALREHTAQQAIVDSRPSPTATATGAAPEPPPEMRGA